MLESDGRSRVTIADLAEEHRNQVCVRHVIYWQNQGQVSNEVWIIKTEIKGDVGLQSKTGNMACTDFSQHTSKIS